MCNDKGIRLITIFSDEWMTRKEQVKGFLTSVVGVCEQRVFARKCDVRVVESKTAREFLHAYHIQGKVAVRVAFGLYYKDELLGLVTGNKHHRNVTGNVFVLNRLVFKKGVLIVGGASRLLKRLIKHATKEGYTKMVSWSDSRWSEGNVYRKLNFTQEAVLRPDYSYTDCFVRFSKQSCTKKNLLAQGAYGNTEHEMAQSLDLLRVYDCGKIRWVVELCKES